MEDFSHRAQVHLQRILDASGDSRFSPSSSRRTSAGRPAGSTTKPRASRGSISAERSAAAPPLPPGTGVDAAMAAVSNPYAVQAVSEPQPISESLVDTQRPDQHAQEASAPGADAMNSGGRSPADDQSWRNLHDDSVANAEAGNGERSPADDQSWRNLHDDSVANAEAGNGERSPADDQSWRNLHDDSVANADDQADRQSWRNLNDDGASAQRSADAVLPADLTSLAVRVNEFARAPPSEVLQNPDESLARIEQPVDASELPRSAAEVAQLLRQVPTAVLQNYTALLTVLDAEDALHALSTADPQPDSSAAHAAREVAADAEAVGPDQDAMRRDGEGDVAVHAAVPLAVVAELEDAHAARRAVEQEEAAAWLDLVCAHWKAAQAGPGGAGADVVSPAAQAQRRETEASADDATPQPRGSLSTSAVDPEAGMDRFRFPSGSVDESSKPKPTFVPRAAVNMFEAEEQDPLLRLMNREEDDRRAVSGDEQGALFDILEAMDRNIQRSYRNVQQQYPNVTDAVAARYPANMSPEAIAVCIAVEQEVIRLRQKVKSLEERMDYAKEDNRDLRRTVELSERRSSVAIARSRASSVLNGNWEQDSTF